MPRRLAAPSLAMLALLAGCGDQAAAPGNERQAAARPPAAAVANEAVPDPPQSEAALAAMSPGQRRAYERGLADCRAGRYQPANHPEAYRIGCAAAQENRAPACLLLPPEGGDAAVTLAGRLSRHVFPGPPNYESVQGGDEPEETYVLALAAPICIDDGGHSAEPGERVDSVQLYTGNEALWPQLRAGIGRRVHIAGRGFAAHTGHHHAPLVVDVAAIRIEGR